MTIFEEKVYMQVKKIPKGRVDTYKGIAIKIGSPNACRAVGNALHKNPDPKNVPCYRVVNDKGECSVSFAFGGKHIQANKLKVEGIRFKDGRVMKEFFI